MDSGSRIHAGDVFYSLRALGFTLESLAPEYIILRDDLVTVVLEREWMSKNREIFDSELIRQVKWVLDRYDDERLRRLIASLVRLQTTLPGLNRSTTMDRAPFRCSLRMGENRNSSGPQTGTLHGDDFIMTGRLERASLT